MTVYNDERKVGEKNTNFHLLKKGVFFSFKFEKEVSLIDDCDRADFRRMRI